VYVALPCDTTYVHVIVMHEQWGWGIGKRQHARRPRGLLGVARSREAQGSAYLARDDPVRNSPLCCQELLFFSSLRRPHASPWPTEEQVRVRIVAGQTSLHIFQNSHPTRQTNRNTKRKHEHMSARNIRCANRHALIANYCEAVIRRATNDVNIARYPKEFL